MTEVATIENGIAGSRPVKGKLEYLVTRGHAQITVPRNELVQLDYKDIGKWIEDVIGQLKAALARDFSEYEIKRGSLMVWEEPDGSARHIRLSCEKKNF